MEDYVTLFLCGDVMTGRGIDQVMPHAGCAQIHESYMKSAKGYVEIAESKNGLINKPVNFAYIWGIALDEMKRMNTDVRIINLETSVTQSDNYWMGKGINYRMHPQNIPCLTAADIDCCCLANNHVLDWGYEGLRETIASLFKANIRFTGAGKNRQQAQIPAILEIQDKARIIVFSYGLTSSGIPMAWQAEPNKPGVNVLTDLSTAAVKDIRDKVNQIKQPGDLVIFSLHWGGNWGYDIPTEHVDFAHALIDEAGVDIFHGHSSHHAKGIEVYKDKPVFYGCGDFIDDYEGISGHETYRSDLGLMYFVRMSPLTGRLIEMRLIPTRLKKFCVNRACDEEALWLVKTLNRENRRFSTRLVRHEDHVLELKWQ